MYSGASLGQANDASAFGNDDLHLPPLQADANVKFFQTNMCRGQRSATSSGIVEAAQPYLPLPIVPPSVQLNMATLTSASPVSPTTPAQQYYSTHQHTPHPGAGIAAMHVACRSGPGSIPCAMPTNPQALYQAAYTAPMQTGGMPTQHHTGTISRHNGMAPPTTGMHDTGVGGPAQQTGIPYHPPMFSSMQQPPLLPGHAQGHYQPSDFTFQNGPGVPTYAPMASPQLARDLPNSGSPMSSGDQSPVHAARACSVAGGIAYRTCEEICRGNRPQAVQLSDLPQQSDATSVDELIRLLNLHCTARGFSVYGFGCRPANKSRGTVQRVKCSDYRKTTCGWEAQYEFATDGFALIGIVPKHYGHEANRSITELGTSSTGRCIPESFMPLGKLLADSGLPCCTIERVFATKSLQDDVPITWMYKDLYNKFCRESCPKSHDAKGIVELLAFHEREYKLRFFFGTDESGHLSRIWVQLPKSLQEWARGDVHNVLLMDSTFGTNKYGMKLTFFATIAADGKTALLAYMIHFSESVEDFLWGMRCFNVVFFIKPATIITDSGPGYLSALEIFTQPMFPWAGVPCLICVYHLDQNFYDHVHPLFAHSREKWHHVHNMFWVLAKSADRWVDPAKNFSVIREYVSKEGKGASKAKALEWLDNTLEPKLPRFAASYTWQHFTSGAHTTARSESLNAAVKPKIRASSTLVQLHQALRGYITTGEYKKEVTREQSFIRNSLMSLHIPPWIAVLQSKITDYAYQLLISQFQQCLAYSYSFSVGERYACTDIPLELQCIVNRIAALPTGVQCNFDASGRVVAKHCKLDYGLQDAQRSHWTTIDDCSCGYLQSYGVLCRHILCLRVRLPVDHISFVSLTSNDQVLQLFSGKWLQRTVAELDEQHTALCNRISQQKTKGPDDDWLATMANTPPLAHEPYIPPSHIEPPSPEVPSPAEKPTPCYKGMQVELQRTGVTLQSMELSHVRAAYMTRRNESRPEAIQMKDAAFGKFIIIKYGHRNSSKWYVARLGQQISVSSNWNCSFEFVFTANKEVIEARLMTTNYFNPSELQPRDQFPKFSWCFVEPALLSAAPSASGLHDPLPRSAPGRPAKRKSPHSGPLSH